MLVSGGDGRDATRRAAGGIHATREEQLATGQHRLAAVVVGVFCEGQRQLQVVECLLERVVVVVGEEIVDAAELRSEVSLPRERQPTWSRQLSSTSSSI